MSYDIFGTGRTALKVNVGRYLAAAFCTKVPKRAQRIAPQVSGLPARGDSPMQRYAREQRPKPTTSTAQHWPEFLQKQVMAEPAVEAANA